LANNSSHRNKSIILSFQSFDPKTKTFTAQHHYHCHRQQLLEKKEKIVHIEKSRLLSSSPS